MVATRMRPIRLNFLVFMNELYKKIEKAIYLIDICKPSNGEPYELCYSGGKDSDVILELTKMSGAPYIGIYKNTTIDPPGTVEHAEQKGVEIIYPKENFFKMIEKKGLPSRYRRWCCNVFKEYKILDNQILGIRRFESKKRMQRYKEPVICRTYRKNERVNQILPILDWTNEDVENFINLRKIQCHKNYYENGNFNVNKRLGCIGCPLASCKKRIQDFKKYKGILIKILESVKIYRKTHIDNYFSNEYEELAYQLFFNDLKLMKEREYTLFGDANYERIIKDIFNI